MSKGNSTYHSWGSILGKACDRRPA